jgi:gliding motility-associated-like protein
MKTLRQNQAKMRPIPHSLALGLAWICIFIPQISLAQPGIWTWMNGSNATNGLVSYGVQGIAAPGNTPPGVISPAQWRDHAGNFWLYGGGVASGQHGDLWSYNPISKQWAWINGPGVSNSPPVYGAQGISDLSNYPGARSYPAATWVDQDGNLWMFGGMGYDANGTLGALNDLWKYDVANDTWIWVTGSNLVNSTGNYGVFQTPATSNQPPARFETSASWTTPDGILWLYGGANGGSYYNDLWKFDPATGMWTWMHGAPGMYVAPLYGTQGVPAGGNTPGGRKCYSSWTDNCGNLWLFGGRVGASSGDANDIWKFDLTGNMWTWMGGPPSVNAGGANGSICQANTGFIPCSRWANSASCSDPTGRFWQFGGRDYFSATAWNDLWVYNPYNAQFSCVKGIGNGVSPTQFGTMQQGISSNMPPERYAGAGWSDLAGNVWMFGGSGYRNDMWKFTPGINCPGWVSPSNANFNTDVKAGCAPVSVNFFNTSTLSNQYKWYFGDGTTSTAAQPSHTFTQPGTYMVTLVATDSNNCSQLAAMDTMIIEVVASLTLDLGSDTTLCNTTPLTLNAGPAGFTYSWSNGATSPEITTTTSGIYSVTVSGGSCFLFDSISVTMSTTPTLNLGEDTILCGNGTLLLDANTAGMNIGYDFQWSTSETTTQVLAANPGLYSVSVTNENCTIADTIQLGFYLPPQLPTDTTVCEGTPITLSAEPAGGNFIWNTGESTASISLTTPGLYSITVSNPGCIQEDTVLVTVTLMPVVNLGPDSVLCDLVAYELDAENTGLDYIWSSNQFSQQIFVTESNWYIVTVSNGSCATVDSVHIQFAGPPQLGSDTTSCPGIPFLLDAGFADSYEWNTGQHSQSMLVNGTGTYWVETTWGSCVYSDTISVTFKPFPLVDLGPDRIACPNEMVTIDADPVGFNNGSHFNWSTGATTQSILVRSTANYVVTVTYDGCTSTDTISLQYEANPNLGEDRSLCEESPIVLDAGIRAASYLWSEGSTNSQIEVDMPGIYWVEITTDHCALADTVFVTGDAGQGSIFAPNVFTPNDDGFNDGFKISGAIFTHFELAVYSRWGELVFMTNNSNAMWNGNTQKGTAPEDVYTYILKYRTPCTGAIIQEYSGTLTLLR